MPHPTQEVSLEAGHMHFQDLTAWLRMVW